MKLFEEEIQKFHQKLANRENFSIARFGDGEMMAMRGDTIPSGYGEWMTNGPDPLYTKAREYLKESFVFQDPGYYVGIVCPCCQGQENFEKMKRESAQEDSQLTYANIFVNSNYEYFQRNFVPLFAQRNVVLVANKTSTVQNLPFGGEFYGVEYDAWVKNIDLINHLESRDESGKLFLFACGPLGKILSQRLWKANKKNTYLDIGSTLHPWLNSDINIRGYYTDDPFWRTKICNWG